MMTTGKIQFAESEGTFVLKFIGDVRLTLCAALDAYIEKIFSVLTFNAIIIDLTETDGIDSTSLGLLAKLSILSRQKVGFLPTLVSTQDDMNRLLQSMGFDQVFNIVSQLTPTATELEDLPGQELSEELVKDKVLEAHRILMNLLALFSGVRRLPNVGASNLQAWPDQQQRLLLLRQASRWPSHPHYLPSGTYSRPAFRAGRMRVASESSIPVDCLPRLPVARAARG